MGLAEQSQGEKSGRPPGFFLRLRSRVPGPRSQVPGPRSHVVIGVQSQTFNKTASEWASPRTGLDPLSCRSFKEKEVRMATVRQGVRSVSLPGQGIVRGGQDPASYCQGSGIPDRRHFLRTGGKSDPDGGNDLRPHPLPERPGFPRQKVQKGNLQLHRNQALK